MTIATECWPDIGLTCPASETCESAERATFPTATYWSGGFPARTSAWPDAERVFALAHDLVFGSSLRGLLAIFDPASCCWKTSQLSLFETEPSYLATLPRWGLMRAGELYERPTPTRPTSGNDGSAWPTPRAIEKQQHNSQDNGVALSKAVTLWPTITVHGNYNRQGLSPQSGDGLATAIKKWATPAARDWKNGQASPATMERNSRPLNEQAVNWPTPRAGNDTLVGGAHQRETFKRHAPELFANRGQLNPAWVEMLQGYPPGWTRIED